MPKIPISYSFSWRIVFGDSEYYKQFMGAAYVPPGWSSPDNVVIGQQGYNFIMIMKSEFFTGMTDQAFVDLFCETYERCDQGIRNCDSITSMEMVGIALEGLREVEVPDDVMNKIFRIREIIGRGPGTAIHDAINDIPSEPVKPDRETAGSEPAKREGDDSA
jgi:hypothetical protein